MTLVHEIEHFLDCAQRGEKPLFPGEVGGEALQLVLAVYESIETGKAIELGWPSE